MDKEFMLRVSRQELHVIVTAMHEAPYKVVAGLLNKLQGQITEQETDAAAQTEPDEKQPD
jgi:hypothetical protein